MANPKPLIRAGNWELGQNLPPGAERVVNNPELFPFFGALGLVMIAAFVAIIMGLAQDSRRAREKRMQSGK